MYLTFIEMLSKESFDYIIFPILLMYYKIEEMFGT